MFPETNRRLPLDEGGDGLHPAQEFEAHRGLLVRQLEQKLRRSQAKCVARGKPGEVRQGSLD